MKSVAELHAIKDKMKNEVVLREGAGDIRVVVSMGTSGIASGAREILNAFVEEVFKKDLAHKVSVTQTGAFEENGHEPAVEIFENGKDKVTYVNMTADKVKEVVVKHLAGGEVIEEYTVEKA